MITRTLAILHAMALVWVGLQTARAAAPVSVAHTNYHGWPNSLRLSNGEVEVIVVPAIGRVMQFGFAGEEGVLWENRALDGKSPDADGKSWINFGGDKTWPSPEAEWSRHTGHEGWLPPSSFDGIPAIAAVEEADIILTTPTDRSYGISAHRRIHLDPLRPILKITTSYHRLAGEPSKVGVWVITQLKDPSGIFVPQPLRSSFGKQVILLSPALPPDLKVEQDLVSLTRDRTSSFKIGTDAGTLVWVGPKAALRIDAPRVAGAEYPDQGSSVEVYTNPDPLEYIELETLGPLQTMKVGDQIVRTNTYTLFHRTASSPEAEARRLLSR